MRVNNKNILKILNERLKYLNYSETTIRTYHHYVEKFLLTTNKYYQHLTSHDFQEYLNQYLFTSVSQQNQIISSLKFFYEIILQKKYIKVNYQRPINERKLPKIIDNEYLLSKLNAIKNIKHKAILCITYSTGMRVSEIINLKISDIDSRRMVIIVRNGKGKKDRTIPLSSNILNLLREYYKQYKPTEYLFYGQNTLKYSTTSCNRLVKKYVNLDAHMHLLRHSCFTTLLENGTDIRIIQKIAGHKNIKTTEIYTHVSTNILKNIILPI